MNTLELKSNLYNLINKTKDIDVLYAIEILLQKQFKTTDKPEANTYELSKEHKIILDERLKSYYENPDDLISWDEVKEQINK
jgi:Putative addiction module component